VVEARHPRELRISDTLAAAMIRGARPGDVDAIAELYERSFGTLTFLPMLHTLEEHRVWFGRVVDQQEVWVWEEDGLILAFIGLGEAMVNYLYVEPEITGRGIGSALLDHAKRRRPAGFTLWNFSRTREPAASTSDTGSAWSALPTRRQRGEDAGCALRLAA
jgi:GNAT superfamily N-acetyltransferase